MSLLRAAQLAGLLAYCAVLVLAGPPARYAGFKKLNRFSQKILNQASVVQGLALFHDGVRRDKKTRHQCVRVQAAGEAGQALAANEIGTGCRENFGLHWGIDPEELMTFRLLMEAKIEAVRVKNKNPQRERSLLSAFGQHQCRIFSALDPDQVTVDWRQSLIDYDSGETSEHSNLFLRWNCKSLDLMEFRWG
jgi:hypothetical protein